MNKTELVASMAEKAGITKKDAEKALAAFVDSVAAELKAGGSVQLIGFGTRVVKIEVLSLNETIHKEDAALMYKIIE